MTPQLQKMGIVLVIALKLLTFESSLLEIFLTLNKFHIQAYKMLNQVCYSCLKTIKL